MVDFLAQAAQRARLLALGGERFWLALRLARFGGLDPAVERPGGHSQIPRHAGGGASATHQGDGVLLELTVVTTCRLTLLAHWLCGSFRTAQSAKSKKDHTIHSCDHIRSAVRERYGSLARKDDESDREEGCCGSEATAAAGACCGGTVTTEDYSTALGYSAKEQAAVPEGSNLGLGCGNPIAAAKVQPGQTVLDLGSGAGFDCFLAAAEVGPTGKVIGVDMTADMLLKARRNAEKGGYANVKFRLGEIEHLPLADASVDVIISYCVINLSPDKPQVFREAFRVLKPGRPPLHFRRGDGCAAFGGSQTRPGPALRLFGWRVGGERIASGPDGSRVLGGENSTEGREP